MAIRILLLSIFLPTVQINALDTTDSVYFHIQIDTLRDIHVGQVVELTYALVNSQFETASYPVFNDSIEQVNGPKPHKSSSYALVNGVEDKHHETGFRYLVRFRQSGEINLPAASVTVGSQTYTTPEYRVSVHPTEVDMSTLKCDLQVRQLTGGFAKYRATLTCNTCPDQNPPLLSINGKTAQPDSKSYSSSNGKTEYVYNYYFTSEGYEVACQELTFGGKTYAVRAQKSKIDEMDFLIIILIVGALFELIYWLAYRFRYRQEKDAALAAFVLEKKTLPLIISWAYTHYGVSHMLLLFSVIFLSMMGIELYVSDMFVNFFFWIGISLVPLAYVSYRIQRRKLDFESIPISSDKQTIYDKIYKLAETYGWEIDHYGEDCIVAHTNPAIWHLTWGEQIFIVFDKGQIWVNSVNDLNKRTSISSFGYTKRNIRRVREALIET